MSDMSNHHFYTKWVSDAKAGDQEAITQLYQCTYQEVYIVIQSMIHNDENTVLDLLQDTFLKAFQKLDQLENPENIKGWIKQIARNTALDHLKKNRAFLFSELNDDENAPAFEPEDEDLTRLPDIVIDRKETARLLHEILDSLPDGQRAVISMHYLQDIPIKEIAVSLNRSEGTIKAQLRNGRQSIEKKVRELEKKHHIRLYSLAPLPFLLLLLRNMESAPMQPDTAILGNILQSTAIAPGSATVITAGSAQTATASVTATAGNAVVQGLVGKIAAGIAAAVILCGGAAWGFSQTQSADTPTEQPQQTTAVTAPAQSESQLQHNAYDALIEDYCAVIRGDISVNDSNIDLNRYDFFCTPAESHFDADGYFVVRGNCCYSFVEYDINHDGIKELIILEETPMADNTWHSVIFEIYTFHDEQPVWLTSAASRSQLTLCENSVIRQTGSGGAEAHGYNFYVIQDGKLVLIDEAEEDWGTFYVNGEKCTKEVFDQTISKYEPVFNTPFEWITIVEPQDRP